MAQSKPYPLRLSEGEHDLLRQVAKHHDRERSDLLRWLLKQEARRLGLIDGEAPEPQASIDGGDGPKGFDD